MKQIINFDGNIHEYFDKIAINTDCGIKTFVDAALHCQKSGATHVEIDNHPIAGIILAPKVIRKPTEEEQKQQDDYDTHLVRKKYLNEKANKLQELLDELDETTDFSEYRVFQKILDRTQEKLYELTKKELE